MIRRAIVDIETLDNGKNFKEMKLKLTIKSGVLLNQEFIVMVGTQTYKKMIGDIDEKVNGSKNKQKGSRRKAGKAIFI